MGLDVVAFARLDEHVDNAENTFSPAVADFGNGGVDLFFINIRAVHAFFVWVGHSTDEFGNFL